MKKWLITVLILSLIFLQARLWVGEGSIAHVMTLKREIEKQQAENALLKAKNDQLAAEVQALKTGNEAIEAKARQDMGYIKEGETYFMVIEKETDKGRQNNSDK